MKKRTWHEIAASKKIKLKVSKTIIEVNSREAEIFGVVVWTVYFDKSEVRNYHRNPLDGPSNRYCDGKVLFYYFKCRHYLEDFWEC